MDADLILQQLANGVLAGGNYAVVAVGFALVFSIMHVVNVSHPEVVMVGAYATYLVAETITNSLLITLPIAIVTAVALGLLIERIVIRPTRGRYVLIPFVATIGVSVILQYSAQRIFGVDPVRVPVPVPGVQQVGPLIASNMQLLTFAVAVALMVAVHLYVRRTRWGKATRAVAERHDVAAALGINVNRVSQLTMGIAAGMAGAAGAMIALSQGQAAPFLGVVYGLKSFIVMLIAGNRHIEGVVLVAVLLGVLESFVAGFISSSLRDLVAFGALVVVLYFRPSGLFGSYERER